MWKDNQHLPDLLVFAARLSLEAEDFDRAGKLLRRVFKDHPKHSLATTEQRLLDRRWDLWQKNQKKGGFLSKLLGRK